MGRPIGTANSLIVSTFQSSLLHQLVIILGIAAILAIAWNALRASQLQRAVTRRTVAANSHGGTVGAPPLPTTTSFETEQSLPAEPTARKILRIAFGLLWVFDGILQAQAAMPIGLTSEVIQPLSAASPHWLQHFLNSGILIWNNHPIEAAVAAVWVQVGIGLWLLVAPRGRWLQAGAVVSIGWGLVVWSFGEAFGGIFSPDLSWAFGAPGAVLIYCLAGGLIALPERLWARAQLGRSILALVGIFFVGMAVLQAWPGRGFWQGAVHGRPIGAISAMTSSMAATQQPRFLAKSVTSFSGFVDAHGFAVNLFLVVALAGIGIAFCTGQRRVTRYAVIAAAVVCLADWVLIEDFGFFGGVGTDPNSMIPMIVVFVAGYVAMTEAPALATAPSSSTVAAPWINRLKASPSYAFRTLAAAGAVVVTLLGAAPMALASTNPNADAIVTEAINGTPQSTDAPAPTFTLSDQHGQSISLQSLRGKVLAITFLDPVCTSDCPEIGVEFGKADRALGAAAAHTEFIAIVANPIYRSAFYMNAFDREDDLTTLHNWLFLTGDVATLQHVWDDYGVQAVVSPAGAMVDHSDIAYVIDANGDTRYIMSADPGAGTSTTMSSFAELLDQEVSSLLASAR